VVCLLITPRIQSAITGGATPKFVGWAKQTTFAERTIVEIQKSLKLYKQNTDVTIEVAKI